MSKNITIRVSDDMFLKIKSSADDQNLTVTDYLLYKAVPGYLDKTLTVDKVIKKIASISQGEIFSLKSLYEPHVWEEFSASSCISTGRLFKKAYESNIDNLQLKIKYMGLNGYGLAIYKKTN